MKRITVLAAVVMALAMYAVAGTASASSNSPCGSGTQVVNVTYTLVNDYDSGVGVPQGWANDTLIRHFQIWDLGGGMYCANLNDNGSFVTFAGSSPEGAPDALSAGITGQINGGYTTLPFSATLNPDPPYPTHGNLGTFDLQCTSAYDCPGAHPSFLSYFSGSPSWGFADWAWTYHTAQNGTWVNAMSGNSGDITG